MKEQLKKNVSDFLNSTSELVGCYESDDFSINVWHYLTEQELTKIKSPIEQILFIALKSIQKTNKIEDMNPFDKNDLTYFQITKYKIDPEKFETCLVGLGIETQVKIGTYFVDFLISYSESFNTKEKKIIIECDGHDFHDKNKQQRAYEKERDRFLQKQGYKIFHYTGSEIVKKPYRIACEIISEITGRSLDDLYCSLGQFIGGDDL